MKNRLSRSSRGYIGSDFRYQTSTVVINPSKHYNETLKGQMLSVEYPNPYTPPKQWVSLPSLTGGDQKFVGVHTVWNDFSNFVAFRRKNNMTRNTTMSRLRSQSRLLIANETPKELIMSDSASFEERKKKSVYYKKY
jgi:hypothetical protein